MRELTNCPCCKNHCLKNSLKCNKGIMYFSKEKLKEKLEINKQENHNDKLKNIVFLFKKIRRYLKRNKNIINLDEFFNTLDNEEINLLENSLKKLYENCS